MQSGLISWWTWVVNNTKCWSWSDFPSILAYNFLSHFLYWAFVRYQASQIVEGCELSYFYPMLQNNYFAFNTLWLQDLQGSSSFAIKRKLGVTLSLLCSIHKIKLFWLPVTLGSPKFHFSILWLPLSCLVWLAHLLLFLLPSFPPSFTSLQPSFTLVCSLFLHLFCSPPSL